MSIFFFHLYDDVVSRDEEGTELPDLAAARVKALFDARAMASAEVIEGRLNLGHRIEVEDEQGRVVTTIHFRDAIQLEGWFQPEPLR